MAEEICGLRSLARVMASCGEHEVRHEQAGVPDSEEEEADEEIEADVIG